MDNTGPIEIKCQRPPHVVRISGNGKLLFSFDHARSLRWQE